MEWLIWAALCLGVGLAYSRFTPGNCCGCGVNCDIADDNFNRASIGSDWSSVSGTWAITSNQLTTSSSDAIITWDASVGHAEMVAIATLSSTTVGDKHRIIIAYSDTNNYIFAEWEHVSGSQKTLSLWKKVGGTETQLGSSVTETAGVIRLCYDGSSAAIRYNNAGTISQIRETAGTFSGTKAGLGTGSSLSGTATFDNFELYIHNAAVSGCATCFVCANCDNDRIAAEYSVSISSVANNGSLCPTSGSCSNDCTVFNGTFVLDEQPISGSNTPCRRQHKICDVGAANGLCGSGFLGQCAYRDCAVTLEFDGADAIVIFQMTDVSSSSVLDSATYTKATTDCLSVHTLTKSATVGIVCTFPSSVILSPL